MALKMLRNVFVVATILFFGKNAKLVQDLMEVL